MVKELKTTDNGGFPYDLNDIRWLQDGVRETFAALIKTFDNSYQAIIICGCQISDAGGGNSILSEGYIYIAGQIYYVPAIAVPFAYGPGYLWVISNTFDANGLETFEDLTNNNTYQINRVQLQSSGSGVDVSDAVFLRDIIHKNSWVTATLASNFTSSIVGGVKVRLEKNGEVTINAKVYWDGTGTPTLIFTLPVGYRPNRSWTFIVANNEDMNATANDAIFINVKTNGEVVFTGKYIGADIQSGVNNAYDILIKVPLNYGG